MIYQYVEDNYYEFFGDNHTKYLVLRFIKREDGNNLIYDLTKKIELKIFVEKIFHNLLIIVCRNLERNCELNKPKMIFEDFFDYIRVKYGKCLQLEYIPEVQKYSLSEKFLVDAEQFQVCYDINDFFKQIEDKFQIKLTNEEKDDFIVKNLFK